MGGGDSDGGSAKTRQGQTRVAAHGQGHSVNRWGQVVAVLWVTDTTAHQGWLLQYCVPACPLMETPAGNPQPPGLQLPLPAGVAMAARQEGAASWAMAQESCGPRLPHTLGLHGQRGQGRRLLLPREMDTGLRLPLAGPPHPAPGGPAPAPALTLRAGLRAAGPGGPGAPLPLLQGRADVALQAVGLLLEQTCAHTASGTAGPPWLALWVKGRGQDPPGARGWLGCQGLEETGGD